MSLKIVRDKIVEIVKMLRDKIADQFISTYKDVIILCNVIVDNAKLLITWVVTTGFLFALFCTVFFHVCVLSRFARCVRTERERKIIQSAAGTIWSRIEIPIDTTQLITDGFKKE